MLIFTGSTVEPIMSYSKTAKFQSSDLKNEGGDLTDNRSDNHSDNRFENLRRFSSDVFFLLTDYLSDYLSDCVNENRFRL